jgi:DNA invertase Pin-like site-specific DNA recombinase
MRAVLYARVSTVDKGQDAEVQLGDLREYPSRRGFEVVAEFVDYASGARNGRPEYQRMLDAARKRRFDIMLVWRYALRAVDAGAGQRSRGVSDARHRIHQLPRER